MPEIEVIPSTPEHVRLLGNAMREPDAQEITCLGLSPHKVLWRSYKTAVMRRTALVDGVVAAMWGVAGEVLGRNGAPYLVTGPACDSVSPVRFARIYRAEVAEMLNLFPRLENYVHCKHFAAVRMLGVAGFSFGPPVEIQGFRELFRKFEIQR